MSSGPAQGLLVTASRLLAIGVLMAVMTLMLAAASVMRDRQVEIDGALQRGELLARVLEEHATRGIDTASLALAALGDALTGDATHASPRISQPLRQTLANVPLLRSVAVVDRSGLVLASTAAGVEGRRLRLDALGPLPEAGRDALGSFVAARDLSALAQGAPPEVRKGVGFLPIVRLRGSPRHSLG